MSDCVNNCNIGTLVYGRECRFGGLVRAIALRADSIGSPYRLKPTETTQPAVRLASEMSQPGAVYDR